MKINWNIPGTKNKVEQDLKKKKKQTHTTPKPAKSNPSKPAKSKFVLHSF